MTKFTDLLNNVTPTASNALIVPIDDPKIKIEESAFDGEKETDWMCISSPYLLSDNFVKEWADYYSGLDKWYIVNGYPFLNGYNRYEWRLRR